MGTTVPTLFAYPGMGNVIHAASDSSVPTQCDNVGSGSTASRDRDRSQVMLHPHFSFRGQPTPYGHWVFQPTSAPYGPGVRNEPPRGQVHDSSSEAVSQDSQPGPSHAFPPGEDVITPFVSDSERGDLFSSDDSAPSEDTSPPLVKRLKLDKGMSSLLKGATETPLKNEKRKKLTSRFPLPSSDAAHPPKLDKAIAAIL